MCSCLWPSLTFPGWVSLSVLPTCACCQVGKLAGSQKMVESSGPSEVYGHLREIHGKSWTAGSAVDCGMLGSPLATSSCTWLSRWEPCSELGQCKISPFWIIDYNTQTTAPKSSESFFETGLDSFFTSLPCVSTFPNRFWEKCISECWLTSCWK